VPTKDIMYTALVLGGYGFFGLRICEALLRDRSIRVLIGGRRTASAKAAAQSFGLHPNSGVEVDAQGRDLPQRLADLGVNMVIHAAGPFQGQDYAVARAAIEAGCNYIDLADGRQFVVGIESLHEAARDRGVTVISGASSVPGLSSAVVERYLPQFRALRSIEMGISSGARAPGLATVRGVFGYCGKPFQRFQGGAWVDTYGWLDLRRYRFPHPLGSRWLGSSDVPDLDLFPRRYPTARTVTFHAGFASDPGHLVVWLLAALVKVGVLRSASPFAAPLNRLSRWMEPLVSDKGGMFVKLEGTGHDGNSKLLMWHLIAAENHGPHIPCGASIALTRKLASGQRLPRGAMPCLGLLTIDEYLAPLTGLNIRVIEA
jgi:saccharopine dehydrogenase-like NADP-dependent oxidoreductase